MRRLIGAQRPAHIGTMKRVFFIVGPTAVGKSEIAAEVAQHLGAKVLSADAFQIYRGLDLLTAKAESATLAKAPHHLIGAFSLSGTVPIKWCGAFASVTDSGFAVNRSSPR